jgi:hypothetical protein
MLTLANYLPHGLHDNYGILCACSPIVNISSVSISYPLILCAFDPIAIIVLLLFLFIPEPETLQVLLSSTSLYLLINLINGLLEFSFYI